MIRYLAIRNLAVIESVAVDFEHSFNILTGETGAGKSILVEAVGLLLGGRATQDLIRTGEDLATVEAIFETEDGSELIVRREITSQGRSRAFINGALATAAALKDLSNRLVELHGQHEHQQLLDPAQHLRAARCVGGPRCRARRRRRGIRARARPARAARSAADGRSRAGGAPRPRRVPARRAAEGEPASRRGRDARRRAPAAAQRRHHPAALRRELRGALRHRGRRARRSSAGSGNASASWPAIDPRFAPYLEARDGIKAQLEDLAFTLRDFAGGIDASPARLQQVEDRLALIERLKRKHGGTLEEAIAHRDRAGRRAQGADRRAVDRRGDRAAACRRRPHVPGGRQEAVRQPPRGGADGSRSRSKPSSPTWRWSGPGSRSG